MKRRTFLISGLKLSAGAAFASSKAVSLLTLNPQINKPEDISKLRLSFLSPPEHAKPYTIWHWMNGVVSKEGITADLESFKQVGLGGVQLFLVGGSESKIDDPTNQIMSDKWKSLFRHSIDECARLGLKFGTHNCPGWSSTGYKSIQPEDSMQKVVFTETKVNGGQLFQGTLRQPETIAQYYQDIVCWAIPETSVVARTGMINLSAFLKTDGNMTWQVPEGQWVIIRIGHTSSGKVNLTAPVSGQGLEVDKLNSRPLKDYWKTFPSELIALAGEHAGKTFTRFEIDSYEMGDQNWTAIMSDEFKRRRGYEIQPWLLSVTGRSIINEEQTNRFRFDWKQTIYELFSENYYSAMQSLIHEVPGMELLLEPYGTGREGQPYDTDNVSVAGDLIMSEFWQKPTQWGWNLINATVSGAHNWGKNIIAAEAFTGQPNSAWQVDPYALKSTGDRAFAAGINKLFFHTSAHQPWKFVVPGMTMGQWGTHFGRTQTWWYHGGREWITYLTRSQHLLQQGTTVIDLLLLTYDRNDPKQIPGYYMETIGTDAFLSRLSFKGGVLCLPEGQTYKMLLLPNQTTMRPDIALKLKKLAEAGAYIVGPPPLSSPSLTKWVEGDQLVSEIGKELWAADGKFTGKVFDKLPVKDLLAKLNIDADFEIVSSDSSMPLLWIHRRLNEGDIYFVSNQTDLPVDAEISVPATGRVPEYWHPETGMQENAPFYFMQGNRQHIKLQFTPSGSAFIVFLKPSIDGNPIKEIRFGNRTKPFFAGLSEGQLLASDNGNYEILYNDDSVKRLSIKNIHPRFAIEGSWHLRFLSKQGVKDRTLTKLVSWINLADEAKYYSGTAIYQTQFTFPYHPAKEELYYLDLGEIHNVASIKLNRQDIGILWKPPYRVEISKYLKAGDNDLEIEVTNLWANRMIGDERFPDDLQWTKNSLKVIPEWVNTGTLRPEQRRITFATYKFFTADAPLLPSGLIGPVVVHQVKKFRI